MIELSTMERQPKEVLSLPLIAGKALEVFVENEAYDDEKGVHPNTLQRSSLKAVQSTLAEFSLMPEELYATLREKETLPALTNLRATHMRQDEIDRLIPKMLANLITMKIRQANPELRAEEADRVKRWGMIKLYDGYEGESENAA